MFSKTFIHLILLVLFGIYACPMRAQAAAITNLNSSAETLEIIGNEGNSPYHLAPNATWRMPGKATLRVHGREIRLDEKDEYAIWPNGDVGPQRHAPNSTGFVGR